MQIGPYILDSRVVLAPMAGISDRPFRALCRSFGAAVTATEMLSSNPQLLSSPVSELRRAHRSEQEPRVVQIAGADPDALASFARFNVDEGAQVIDINMGCPVKKVLKQAAGSALLRDEALVATLLKSVVAAVDVPVTLKIRTGWSPDMRNGVTIAKIAEDCGISALAVHGRTRACMFNGDAEYDTIAAIKQAIRIPVMANGDITTPEKARAVLSHTGADAVMIGRGARGRPWIFRDIEHFLRTGTHHAALPLTGIHRVVREHLQGIHAFYGEHMGLGFARKHAAWYLEPFTGAREFRSEFNRVDSSAAQLELLDRFFAATPTYAMPERVQEQEQGPEAAAA
jgi:tRNA-dihydrouridine synthase B